MSEHTPIPWKTESTLIRSETGKLVAAAEFADVDVDTARANAEFIVLACNSYHILMAAIKNIAKGEGAFNRDPLKHAQNCIEHATALADAALALAEPEGP